MIRIKTKANCGLVIAFVIIVIAIYASVAIAFDAQRPSHYVNLWVLPLATGIIFSFVFFTNTRVWSDIRFIILGGLFFLRNIVGPIMMRFGNYVGLLNSLTDGNVNAGIALLIYEELVVLAFAAMLVKRYPTKEHIEINTKRENFRIGLLVGLLLFCALSIAIHPEFMNTFTSLFSGNNIRLLETQRGSAWNTLFGVLFPITYVFLSAFLLCIINQKKTVLSLGLNVLLIVVPLFFMTSSDAFNIILCITLAVYALYSGGISKRVFVFICVFGVIVVVFYIFYLMSLKATPGVALTTPLEKLSIEFQAYLCGICNVASVFNISPSHNKFTTLFYDIYAMIPYRNTLFGLTSDFQMSHIFNSDNGFVSQIVPCVGQLYYYVGIFAPFLELIIVKCAFITYNKMVCTKSPFYFISRCILFIYLIVTPVFYNYTILMSRILITIVPMLIISAIEERKSARKNTTL